MAISIPGGYGEAEGDAGVLTIASCSSDPGGGHVGAGAAPRRADVRETTRLAGVLGLAALAAYRATWLLTSGVGRHRFVLDWHS
jgi:hypothetical protein